MYIDLTIKVTTFEFHPLQFRSLYNSQLKVNDKLHEDGRKQTAVLNKYSYVII